MNINEITKPATTQLKLIRKDRTVKGTLTIVPKDYLEHLYKIKENYLQSSELDKFNEIKYSRRQHSYLMGRYALKKSAAAYIGLKNIQEIEIATAVVKHPVVKYPVRDIPEVTLSHTDTMAIAVAHEAGHVMGIDIEKRDPTRIKAFEREMTAMEKDMINKTPHPYETMANAMWTIKEAMSKAIKVGFMTPFKFLEVKTIVKEKQDIYLSEFRNFAHFKCYTYITKGSIISIVLPIKTTLNLDFNNLHPQKE